MAVIKAVNSKNSIKGIIKYVTDEEKTEEKLISTLNCSPDTVEEEMKFTKESYGKTTGRQYKHFIQSFHPEDKLNAEKSNLIGKEWASKFFNDFEVLIVTHKDKEHLHNHFIINSVSFLNGYKLRYSKYELKRYKEENDRICKREGLHVIEDKKNRAYIDQATAQLAIQGRSWKINLIKDLDHVISKSNSKKEFLESLKERGYEVTFKDNNPNFRSALGNWSISSRRLDNQFGREYGEKIKKLK